MEAANAGRDVRKYEREGMSVQYVQDPTIRMYSQNYDHNLKRRKL
jgi:hypothetical protein